MKQLKTIILILIILAGTYIAMDGVSNFDRPQMASFDNTNIQRMQQHEFQDLFDDHTLTSNLAVAGKYTVVEGYLDSCGICKTLEQKFPAFLEARKDVVIRKVRFEESNSISFTSREHLENYVERMNMYRSNNFVIEGDNASFNTCGTPHIEIYGPDKRIVAADLCSNQMDKSGLAYLNEWIAMEIN